MNEAQLEDVFCSECGGSCMSRTSRMRCVTCHGTGWVHFVEQAGAPAARHGGKSSDCYTSSRWGGACASRAEGATT